MPSSVLGSTFFLLTRHVDMIAAGVSAVAGLDSVAAWGSGESRSFYIWRLRIYWAYCFYRSTVPRIRVVGKIFPQAPLSQFACEGRQLVFDCLIFVSCLLSNISYVPRL